MLPSVANNAEKNCDYVLGPKRSSSRQQPRLDPTIMFTEYKKT
jgi:hypothetical protein